MYSKDKLSIEDRMRIIQEIVPGKQITLAHIIANPDDVLYEKLGMNSNAEHVKSAIGILTMSPGETSIIGADVAIKASDIELGFIDRVSGTLIVTGSISAVEASLSAVINFCENKLDFTICEITRT